MNDDCSVRVAVRVRPLNSSEKAIGSEEVVRVTPGAPQVSVGEKSYTFDFVYGPSSKQHQIYDQCVEALVAAFFEGFNATILAYGQTGSGKTFTMGTSSSFGVEEDMQGIIPRVIIQIFDLIEQKKMSEPHIRYILKLQFLEIYGEDLKDLLDPTSTGVRIHEDYKGGISVQNAKEEPVNSVEELMLALEKGSMGRTTGSTLMNAHSSRSHAIFTLILEQRIASVTVASELLEEEGSENEGFVQAAETSMEQDVETRKSKFHFVDLAGSERLKKTGATGQRMKEGIDINKGLLVLGNVISALGDDKLRGKVHVPYRDSKLTRMLQDSLGGNSKTMFICCCSPAECNSNETEASLMYANRARNIRNKPVVNRDAASALISDLKQQIQMLATELLRAKGEGVDVRTPRELLQEFAIIPSVPARTESSANLRPGTGRSQELGKIRARLSESEAEVFRLTEELKKARQVLSKRDEQVLAMQAERDFLYIKCKENSIDLESKASVSSLSGGEDTKESHVNVGEMNLAGGHSFEMIKGYLAEIASLKAKLEENEEKQQQLEDKMRSHHQGFLNEVQSQFDSFMETGELQDLERSPLIEQAKQDIARESKKLQALKISVEGNDYADSPQTMPETTADEVTAAEDAALLAAVEKQEGELKSQMRNFSHQQAQISSEIADISNSIHLKEKLLQQLQKSEEKYELMKQFYEKKLVEMEAEIGHRQAERDAMSKELGTLEDGARNKSTASEPTNVAKLKKSIKEKDEQLQGLRKKHQELSHLAKQKSQKQGEVQKLESEIQSMKRARVELIRKNEMERKQHAEELNKRLREIETLKKYQKKDQNQLRKIQGEKIKSDKILKRRNEEIASLRQKNIELFNKRSKGSKQQLNEGNARKWLDQKVAEVTKREEELTKLKEEYRRRMALSRQKENLEGIRQSMHERVTLRDLISVEPPSLGLIPNKTTPKPKTPASALTPEEEEALVDIETEIEQLKSQIEVKDKRLVVLRKRMDDPVSHKEHQKRQLDQLTQSVSTVAQAQSVIRLLFNMLVSTRKAHKQSTAQVTELSSQVKRLSTAVDEGERRRTLDVRRFDQEIVKAATEYEQKISGLIDHTHMSGFFQASNEEPFSVMPAMSESFPRSEALTPLRQPSNEGLPQFSPADGSWSFSGLGNPEQFKVMLRLANERNEALRKKVNKLQSSNEEITRWLTDLEGAREKDKEAMEDKEQMLQWLEYDLKQMRIKYSAVKAKLDEVSSSLEQEDEHEPDILLLEPDPIDYGQDSDADSDEIDIPWADIMAIDQAGGRVPEFFNETTKSGHGKNIFERLTNPSTFTGMHKRDEQELEKKKKLVQKVRQEEKQKKFPIRQGSNLKTGSDSLPPEPFDSPRMYRHVPEANQQISPTHVRSSSIFDRLSSPSSFTGGQRYKFQKGSSSSADDSLLPPPPPAERGRATTREDRPDSSRANPDIFNRLSTQKTAAATIREMETKRVPAPSTDTNPPFRPSGPANTPNIRSVFPDDYPKYPPDHTPRNRSGTGDETFKRTARSSFTESRNASPRSLQGQEEGTVEDQKEDLFEQETGHGGASYVEEFNSTPGETEPLQRTKSFSNSWHKKDKRQK